MGLNQFAFLPSRVFTEAGATWPPPGLGDLICVNPAIPQVSNNSDLKGTSSPSFQYRGVPFYSSLEGLDILGFNY